jgi:quinol-cytochrome oxidoreductase complex cytochrome b subunit
MDNYPKEVTTALNILQRIGLSVFPGKRNMKHKENNRPKIFRGFLLHFRPATVPERTLRLSLTWGLGVISAVLVSILFGTGLMLKFAYIASPEKAYNSIVYLNQQIPFGRLLRNVHRCSANGLLLTVFLHFLRIFYTRAFSPPRQFNWIIGLSLFALVILSNFTGYLLPWDQLAYWAITISTSMLEYIPVVGTGLREWILGGSEPGARTLLNFYAIHTAILPALLLFFVPFHFWRIRMANGLVIPRSPEEELPVSNTMVPAMPHLIVRDVSLALVVASILLIAMLFNAPLADPANPGLSPNPTKAPWYFMGIQELLMHFHPVFALLVIPALLVAGLLMIPYFKEDANTTGIWFGSRKGRKMALITVIFGTLVTVGTVLLDEVVFSTDLSGPANMIRNGLLPFGVLLIIGFAFCVLLKRGFAATSNETIQMLFTLLVTAFVVLTMIGIWLRGPGMQLMWMAG